MHHWRAYSLTSMPGRADGCISITPKLVDGGTVSPFLFDARAPGRDRAPGRRRRHVHAARPVAAAAAVHQRRQRDHADHEHAAQPRRRRRDERLRDVVHVHCARTADGVIFGRELRALRRAPRRLPAARAITGEHGRVTADQLDELCPTGASARRSCAVRPACSTRWPSTGRDGRPGAPARRALPARRPCRRRRARPRAARSAFSSSGLDAVSDGEQPILLAGEQAGATHAVRLSHGHLPQLRRAAARGPGPRPAHRPRARPARRDAAHLHQRPRGRRRDRPLTESSEPPPLLSPKEQDTSMSSHPPPTLPRRHRRFEEPESPLAHLSARAARRARPRARRDPRRGLRRPRRARRALHPLDDQAAPPSRARGSRAAARLALQAAVARRHRRAVAREDPREHGDRPQRDARPVGLDERSRHQLPELGLGHGLARRRVAALAQLRAPHVHEHPRQGPRPRLRDHAHRPAPALAPGLSAAAAVQPAADGLLRVGRRPARPQLRRDPLRREAQGAGARGAARRSA